MEWKQRVDKSNTRLMTTAGAAGNQLEAAQHVLRRLATWNAALTGSRWAALSLSMVWVSPHRSSPPGHVWLGLAHGMHTGGCVSGLSNGHAMWGC